MLTDDAHPRWYASLRGFVWGLVLGIGVTTTLYESKLWQAGDIWRAQSFPLLLVIAPVFVLAFFELFFRIRRHLRLQRSHVGSALRTVPRSLGK